ncbi:MAG: hypothetical protein SFY32_07360 [Bacteroidota bacterium]|nr:hypothetical protein [Bacteroidota bacterium]
MNNLQFNQELNTYLPLLNNTQQKLLLDVVKNILNVEPKANRITLKKYNEELDHSSKQIENGQVISNKDLLKSLNEK